MRARPRILFYFLHLLGVGHVYRAKRLIEGFANQGLDVDVIYGGLPIGETFSANSVFYLPPIQAENAEYKNYLDENGDPLTDAYMQERKVKLLEHVASLSPDLVLFEAFPFGRRIVRNEIFALLENVKSRQYPPLIVTSVRDILQPRAKPGRNEETRDIIQSQFDRVLVHSDPNVIKLDETYPLTSAIEDKISYTGFVVPPAKVANDVQSFDIIVSAGGGGFGFELMKRALAVSQLEAWKNFSWCLAVGPHVDVADRATLERSAGENVSIVTRLEGLAAHLAKSKLSISQCGYNTAMDVLAVNGVSDCRAVFVPYDTQGQLEQIKRAQLLERAGFAISVPQSSLTVEALSDAMESALALPSVEHSVDFSGVETTARLVASWLADRRK